MNAKPEALDLKLRILLIEDNPGDARLIQEMLKEPGNMVLAFERADRLSTALERLSTAGIDLVLLDLSLPDSHGPATYHKVHEVAPDTPIVALTGLDDEAVALQLIRDGVQDYLIKGQVDSDLLQRAIRHAIERKCTEKALRESETRFRTLIESNLDAIIIVDREGIVRFANPAAELLFNSSSEEFVGQLFGFPSIVGDREEIELYRGHKQPMVAEMRATEITWEGASASLASIRDISNRKRMEEEIRSTSNDLRRSLKELEEVNQRIIEQQRSVIEEERLKVLLEMAGATAHELNQPLMVLLGNIEILDLVGDEPEKRKACMATIETAGKRIAETVKKIQHIRHYDTKPYAGGSLIIDLEQQVKILSVEDSDEDFDTLRGILEELGQTTWTRAVKLGEAVEILRQEKFDLVLFDFELPDGTALDFMEVARQNDWEIPIVVITGKGNEIIASQIIKEGAYDYLPKTRLTKGSLARSITNTLEKARLKGELRKVQERLKDMAMEDELTELYNRRHLLQVLEQEISRDQRYKHGLALCMIDLDHFKNVNDTYGHVTGDVVLREVGRMIRECFRESDIPCRYGGEEFAVILPNTRVEAGRVACERLREAVANHLFGGDALSFGITISVGLVEYAGAAGESAEDLIRRADEALYRAKREGRDRVVALGNYTD
jgi:two-component system, cell cycle response regulator